MTDAPVICVDGPAGVGKGTLCNKLAQHFGFALLDSGSLYRLTALKVLRSGLATDAGEAEPGKVAARLDVRFVLDGQGGMRIELDGEDVTSAIREEAVSEAASKISAVPAVRAALLQRQRDFAQPPGLVADGRDMGTVVFPDAPAKLFLTADAEERARRRTLQLSESGENAIFDRIYRDILARDERDASRKVAPLKPAEDATVIDTTALSIDEVVAQAIAICDAKMT